VGAPYGTQQAVTTPMTLGVLAHPTDEAVGAGAHSWDVHGEDGGAEAGSAKRKHGDVEGAQGGAVTGSRRTRRAPSSALTRGDQKGKRRRVIAPSSKLDTLRTETEFLFAEAAACDARSARLSTPENVQRTVELEQTGIWGRRVALIISVSNTFDLQPETLMHCISLLYRAMQVCHLAPASPWPRLHTLCCLVFGMYSRAGSLAVCVASQFITDSRFTLLSCFLL
jgi:hypothetical protein